MLALAAFVLRFNTKVGSLEPGKGGDRSPDD